MNIDEDILDRMEMLMNPIIADEVRELLKYKRLWETLKEKCLEREETTMGNFYGIMESMEDE